MAGEERKHEGDLKRSLWEEANRVIVDATYSGRSHQAMGVRWDRWNRMLGVPSVVLSALLAGGAGISAIAGGHRWITASLALVAASLASARGFLKPDENAESHGLKGDRLISLRNDAITFQQVDLLSSIDLDILTSKSKELSARRNALREQPPHHINQKTYEMTKKSIEKGESNYENDKLWKDSPF